MFESLLVASLDIILSSYMLQIVNALTSLCGCAGWSALLLFTNQMFESLLVASLDIILSSYM